jgi:hypothetical protein
MALVKRLHPDGRGQDDPDVRADAERRLAEVNAAYDAIVIRRSQEPGTPGREAADEVDPPVSFTVDAFRAVAFEALLVAAADVGDVTDSDVPFSMELFVEGPRRGFCRLELFPEAGGSVVTAESEQVDAASVGAILVSALQRLGFGAQLVTDGSAR